MIFIVFKMNKCQKWKRLSMQTFTLTNMTFPAPKPCGEKMKTNIDIEKRPLAGIFVWQYDVSSSKIVQRFTLFCFCKKTKNGNIAVYNFGADGGNRTGDLHLTKNWILPNQDLNSKHRKPLYFLCFFFLPKFPIVVNFHKSDNSWQQKHHFNPPKHLIFPPKII